MHGGYPFLEETIAFLHAHPQVYVDVAEINWMIPRAEFHEYLRRLTQSGFGKRLMYGSDWPVCLLSAPDYAAVHRLVLDYTSELSSEARDKFFGQNAARIYRLQDS